MTVFRKLSASAALLYGTWIATAGSAGAVELNGAWASDADQCAKVFIRQGESSGSPKCPTSMRRLHHRRRPDYGQVRTL
jgi:hypothetical protein